MVEDKVVTTEDHECARCRRIIPAGSYVLYAEWEIPEYEDYTLVNTTYYKAWFCDVCKQEKPSHALMVILAVAAVMTVCLWYLL